MRTFVGIVLASFAAYSFSFAIDLLLGGLFGVYPGTAFLPVVTWSAIAVLGILGGVRLSRPPAIVALPFIAFGGLALFGAIVGAHPHSYGVAAAMLAQAAVLGLVLRKTSSQPAPRRNAA
jgi:hypothetical protein